MVRWLGGGGMGDVYLGRDLSAQRLVAMKFLRRAGEQTAFDRFLLELRAMATVDHPGVVRVFTSDLMRDTPYFTMEYAPGDSLGARLTRSGPLEPEEAARLIAAAARAVHAAHDAGVIHRDLKPSNILLGADARPKVSDFGLAKRTDRDDGLTTTTGPVGTPAYMAPEQTSRHYGPIDRGTDVYGLGATLYHLLTGRPPFTGSPGEVIARLLTANPDPPRVVNRAIPLGLEAVVLQCLEKDPTRRYATAAELADDLDRVAAGLTPKAPAATRSRRAWKAVRPRLVPAAMAVAVLIGVFLLGAAVWPAKTEQPAPDPVEVGRKELAAGRPLVIVGKEGGPKHPQYTRPLLEATTLGKSPKDGSCHFVAMEYAPYELFPAPGIKKYRIDLELRHLQSPLFAPANAAEKDYVGLYFGHAALPRPDGAIVHNMFTMTYCDVDYDAARAGTPPQPQPVSLDQFTLLQKPDEPTRRAVIHGKPIMFQPCIDFPGKWRPVRILCDEGRLTALWRDDGGQWVTVADVGPEEFNAWRIGLNLGRNNYLPGASEALPLWNPDAPFGIIAYRASLSFRNVVITPMP